MFLIPGVKRTFPCEEWFGKSESDGQLEKTLYPAVDADKSYKKSKSFNFYCDFLRHSAI